MHDALYEQAQIYLIYILAVSVPLHLVNRMQAAARSGKIIASVIVLGMSLSISWLLVLLCSFLYVLNGLFIILIPAVIGIFGYEIYQLLREYGTSKIFVYLFLGYVAAIFLVTLFARLGTSNSTIYIDAAESIADALTMRDPAKTEHLLLNTLMFIPFGAFYMMMTPTGQKSSYGYYPDENDEPAVYPKSGAAGFFLGIAYSALIESTQLILSMGECDMADIVCNGLGTLIGILIGIVARRFITRHE